MWNTTGPDSNRNAPPGVVPDYNHPEDVYWTLNVVIISICVVLITGFLAARVHVKRTINRKILTEDYTCGIAYVLIMLYCVTVFMMARYGAGYHAWEIRKPEYYNWLKWFYASTVVYCPAAYFTKTTILLLMARVFAIVRRVSKGIRIFIWALLIAYIPVEFLRIFTCWPIRTFWDPHVKNAHCINQRKVFFSSLTLSILTDLIILIIPIPLTWRLRMPLRKKIKIVLLLGAGGVATGLTMFRVYKAVQFLDSDDITVDYTPIEILTALEITIGFICACFPSLNLLFEHKVRKRRHERQNPNWPRSRTSGTFHSTVKRHFRWISSSTDPSTQRPSNTYDRNRNSNPGINMDVELAMLTGQVVSMRTGRHASADSLCCRPLDHRLTSNEGRRDGWLSQDSPDGSDGHQDTDFIMRTVEDAKTQTEKGDEESWCPVWDGPKDTSENLEEGNVVH